MQIFKILLGVALLSLLWGCGPEEPPRYEASGAILFRTSATDLKFETAFLRSETFLRIVFDSLPESDLRDFKESMDDKSLGSNELYRRFVRQTYVRPGHKEGEIEICFLHTDPVVASLMANHIIETYLEGRSEVSRISRRAKPPQKPIKRTH